MSRLASLSGILALAVLNSLPVNAQNLPKAECRESSWTGRVTCGYNCVESSWTGQVACSDWPGGVCKVSSWTGQITCGPSAPPDWLSLYTNSSNSNHRNSGIYGAWAVQNGGWRGILRMRGNYGNMVLVTKTGAAVEQKMTLNINSEGGYILKGELLTKYVKEGYDADNFYIERFSKDSFSVRNCDKTNNCNSVTLTYLGE